MEGVPEWITPQLVISTVAVLVALAVVLVKVGRWTGKVDTEITDLKEDVGELKEDVGVLKEDVGALKEDVGALKKEVGGLKKDVGGLAKLVQEIKVKLDRVLSRSPQLAQPGSPIQLTEKGREAAEGMHADIWAAPHVNALLEKSKGRKEHAIYALCLTYVLDGRDIWPENADEVAYEHGVLVEALATVLAITLRDKLLKQLGSETG